MISKSADTGIKVEKINNFITDIEPCNYIPEV